jgi:hypothetical protein
VARLLQDNGNAKQTVDGFMPHAVPPSGQWERQANGRWVHAPRRTNRQGWKQNLRDKRNLRTCARCGARREVLAVVMRPEPIIAILTHLDLAGPQASPRPPPEQLSLI